MEEVVTKSTQKDIKNIQPFHPIADLVGVFANDSIWDDIVQDIHAFQRERDAEDAAQHGWFNESETSESNRDPVEQKNILQTL